MIYKVLLVKNRYSRSVKIQKYLDWFKKNTPIEIQVETISTDFDVTTTPIGNATYSGVIVAHDIVDKLRTVVPENKYHSVIFIYGNQVNGIRLGCVNGENGAYPLYPNTELIQLAKFNDSGKQANHELFHAFFFKANRRGAKIIDNMDEVELEVDINGNIVK